MYYGEVKSLALIENSYISTLTFLFGAVSTDEFYYWVVLTENWDPFDREWGRFGLGRFRLGRF